MFSGSSWSHTISLGVRVAGHDLVELVVGPRVELLDPHHRDRRAELVARGERVVADLAGGEHHAAHAPTGRRRRGSSSVSRNDPASSSSTGERVDLARSSDFGVKTTSGLRTLRRTWRRSRWKNCDACVQLATWMLSSAHRVRNRSMRAELCSGPWPS